MRTFGYANIEEACAGTELLDDGKGLCESKVGLNCLACSTNGFIKKGEDGSTGNKVGTCLVSGGIVCAGEDEIVKGGGS